MDANLSDRTLRILNRIRDSDIILHYNDHKNCVCEKWYFTPSIIGELTWQISSKDGKKIVSPISSLKKLNQLEDILFPNLKAHLYIARKPHHLRRENTLEMSINKYSRNMIHTNER